MTIRALSKRYCESCAEETLHNSAICLTCKKDNSGQRFTTFQKNRAARLRIQGYSQGDMENILHGHEKIHAAAQRAAMATRPIWTGPRKTSLKRGRARTKV